MINTKKLSVNTGKQARKKKGRAKFTPFMIVAFCILTVYSVLMILLMLWGLSTALKTVGDFRTNKVWLPKGAPWDWAWGNFATVIQYFNVNVTVSKNGVFTPYTIGFGQMFLNTLLYAGVGAVIQALVPCIVAYMTSKFKYKFSSVVYVVVIAALVIPIVGQQASELQLLRWFGLYDTIVGSWIQKFHFLGMYYLVFYAAFKGIPKDFSEAAYMDGASEMRVLVQIMLPMVRNLIFTVMLIKFIEFWNDYQTPLLYLPSHPTLAYGVYTLGVSSRINELASTPMRMASCIILMVPILLLFIAFRNRLMGNLSMGGVKG